MILITNNYNDLTLKMKEILNEWKVFCLLNLHKKKSQ